MKPLSESPITENHLRSVMTHSGAKAGVKTATGFFSDCDDEMLLTLRSEPDDRRDS